MQGHVPDQFDMVAVLGRLTVGVAGSRLETTRSFLDLGMVAWSGAGVVPAQLSVVIMKQSLITEQEPRDHPARIPE